MSRKVMVVSRFEEGLQWVSDALKNPILDQVVVYNKSLAPARSLDPRCSVLNVPNVGREGGTFLDYIIDNHSDLPDGLWFVQGDPFEHSPDFISLLGSSGLYAKKPFQSMSFRYKHEPEIPPKWLLDRNDAFHVEDKRCAHYFVKDMQVSGHCHFHDLGVEFTVREFEKRYGTRDCFGHLADRIGVARPRAYTEFAYGACFYARGAFLARHPRWVYERLRDFLFDTDDQGGFQVYVLERFWPYLISGVSYETLTDCYRESFGDRALGLYDEHSKTAHIRGASGRFVCESAASTVMLLGPSGARCIAGIQVEGEDLFSCPAESLADAKEILVGKASEIGLV